MTFSPLYQYCEIVYVTGMCGMYCQSSLESQAMLSSQFGYLAFEPWHQLVTDHVHSSLCSTESGSWIILCLYPISFVYMQSHFTDLHWHYIQYGTRYKKIIM